MTTRRIHLTAVASPARAELKRLTAGLDIVEPAQRRRGSDAHAQFRDPYVRELVTVAQDAVGPNYRVTANAALILADEDDKHGGRSDDAARAADVEAALADDDVAALVTVRGGAWFVRALDRINFDALKRRRRPIHIFGFSEMTPLVAIAGEYPRAVGLYDFGPGFLYAGLKRHVQLNIERYGRGIELKPEQHEAFAAGWALARFRGLTAEFFRDVAGILEGKASPRVPTGRVLAGKLPASSRIRITGGNLSLIASLMGTPYAAAVDPKGKWLALEELNELPEQCDRMMAGLKHNGAFERAEGVILGDFHNKDGEFNDAAFHVLKCHLPTARRVPVVRLDHFGHVWPMAPLPMHREVTLRCTPRGKHGRKVIIDIPWNRWARA